MVKRIFSVLAMSGVIAVFTTVTQASQAAEQRSVRESDQEQESIVGSWMGTNENGERFLLSFTSDGIAFSSFHDEVSLTRPVLTPGHGVWTRLRRRQFAITDVVILYDIQTGEYQGFGKLRALLTLDSAGDGLSGTAIVDLFGPDGNLVATLSHAFRFTRIKVEPVD